MFYKLWKVNFVPIAPYVPISDMVSRNLKKKGGGLKTIADTNYFKSSMQSFKNYAYWLLILGPKASQYSKDPTFCYTLYVINSKWHLNTLQNKTLHSISLFNTPWWYNVLIHHLWGTYYVPGAEDTRLKDSRGPQWFLPKVYMRLTTECFFKNTWTASHHWRFWFSRSGLKPENLFTETAS